MGLEPLADKFAAFGCAVQICNGNDIDALVETFDRLPFEPGKPNLVFAQTVKGKGVSFIEDAVQWHHRVPNDDEFTAAIKELEAEETYL
jgi:transketolase